jgi:septal ring factor EnvC (AmiA/AmiB activator)
VIERRLKELEDDRKKLDKELRNARQKVSSSEQNKEILEAKLKVRRRRKYVFLYIDYRCADEKKSWRVERRRWRHSISLDSLFQKTPMFTPQKTNR